MPNPNLANIFASLLGPLSQGAIKQGGHGGMFNLPIMPGLGGTPTVGQPQQGQGNLDNANTGAGLDLMTLLRMLGGRYRF